MRRGLGSEALLLPLHQTHPRPWEKGLKERHLEGFGGDFHCTSRLVFQFRSYSQGGNGSDSLCPSQSLLEASLNKFTECGRSRIWTQFLTKLEEKKEMYQAERKSKFRLSTDLQKWRISSVQFRHAVTSDSLWLHGLQHARLPCSSPTPRAYSNSCPLSWWCHPTNSSSINSISMVHNLKK